MAGKQGEGRLLQHGRRGEEGGRDGGEIEEIREREREQLRKCRCCLSKDKEELPPHATVFFSGQVIGSLTPKNHFQ